MKELKGTVDFHQYRNTLKGCYSDFILHLYKVGGLERDRLKNHSTKDILNFDPCMGQAPKTADLTSPITRLTVFFMEYAHIIFSLHNCYPRLYRTPQYVPSKGSVHPNHQKLLSLTTSGTGMKIFWFCLQIV